MELWLSHHPLGHGCCYSITILFALQQWTAFLTTKEDRIFPVRCLKSRKLVLLYIGTAGTSAVLNVNIYYLPLHFQFTNGVGPIEVAVRLLPFVCLIIFSSLLSGAFLPKFNLYAAWCFAPGIIALVGSALLVRISASTPARDIYGYEVLIGAGCGLTFQAAYAIALVKSPAEKATSVLKLHQRGTIGWCSYIIGNSKDIVSQCWFHYHAKRPQREEVFLR